MKIMFPTERVEPPILGVLMKSFGAPIFQRSRISSIPPTTQLCRSSLKFPSAVTSCGQRGKHVEHTSAAFWIKGVAACALRLLAQPFSRPIFPIPVLVVLFPGAGGPGIPWYSAYTCVHTCGCRAVRNYNGRVRIVASETARCRRAAAAEQNDENIDEPRIRFIGKSRRALDGGVY